MPSKTRSAKPKQKENLESQAKVVPTKAVQVQSAGKDVLAKLEEQVQSLTKLADDYLDQGLLGHHEEASQMRDSAAKTLKDVSSRLGLAPDHLAARSESAKPPKLTPAQGISSSSRAAAEPKRPSDEEPCPAADVGAVPVDAAARASAEADTSANAVPGWSQPAGQGGSGGSALPLPRYRWLPQAEGNGATLEVLGPNSGSAAGAATSTSESDEPPEIDVAERVVRCSWHQSKWTLTVPLGFGADSAQCSVVRKRRTGLLQLTLTPKQASPPADQEESRALCAKISGPGCSWMDGFVAGAEADSVRSRLLDLWRGGKFEPGEVEGGRKARVGSDEYLYLEEGDPILSIFTRRLDKLVLQLTKEVPSLRGKWLMRGRAMAAVYAGPGSRYTPHFDAVGGDNGRMVTCILYLNPFWRKGDGAELQIWPEAKTLMPEGACLEVEPLHGRLAVFLCDSQNLHEVKPVTGDHAEPRLAISFWYYDSKDGLRHREDEADGDP
ncbi:unnamed protein product [Polarella glacialis]|uniref:Fe2OG dioxygenase domain-containing protein n=1 Tax=Polarella glacialis TaxID=89957 RepID=A0A813F0Y3_POLGL|nr:unnamed protein product [Polarella glacialis]